MILEFRFRNRNACRRPTLATLKATTSSLSHTQEVSMYRKIALIGAATLLSTSVAFAQSNSSQDSTAGGAIGTSKQGAQQQQRVAPKATTGAGHRGAESS